MSKIKAKQFKVSQAQTTSKNSSFFSKNRYALLIFMVSFLVFANGIQNNYNLDDELVTENHRLTSKGISAIGQIFREPYYKDQMGYQYEYRPIVLTSFAIEHEFFGDNAHISHFFNVLLYSLLCVLLFLVLRKLFGKEWELFSLATTLLFAVHPTHTEIVDSIKNRDEILALAGALFALYYALKYVETSKWQHLLFVVIAYLLALLSKLTITSFVIFIPLALILFRQVSLPKIWLVTTALLIPLFGLINLYLLKERILFCIAVIAINTILYYLKNLVLTPDFVVRTWKKLIANYESYASEISFALPGKNGKIAVFSVLFFLAMSAIAILTQQILLFRLSLIIALLIWLFMTWESKMLLLIPFITILCISLFSTNLKPGFLHSLVVLPLLLLGINSEKKQKGILIVNAVILEICLLAIQFQIHFTLIIIVLITLYLTSDKIKRWILFITFLEFIIGVYFSWKNHNLSILLFIAPVWTIAFYAPKRSTLLKYLVILPIISFTLIALTQVKPLFYSQRSDQLINKISASTAPNVISAVNRPLNFVEVPITNETPFADKLGTSMDIAAKYLKLTILLYPLSFYYGYRYIDSINFWNLYPITVFIIYGIIGLLALYFYQKKPIIAFGIIIYLVSIVSVLPIFTLLPGMMADRFLFIPTLGFGILLSYVLLYFFKSLNSTAINRTTRNFKIVFSAIFAVFTTITLARNNDWKDRLTLFSHDINNVDESAQAHNLLAVHLGINSNSVQGIERRKMLEQSAANFEKALEIYPDFLNPSYDLGRTYNALGELDKAIQSFKNTTRIKPEFSDSYMQIAMTLERQGKIKEAISYYEKTIAVNPKISEAYANLGAIYVREKDYINALNITRKAIIAMPENPIPYTNAAKIFMQQQQMDSAVYYLEEAYKYNSNNYAIVNTLYQLSMRNKDDAKSNFYRSRLQTLRPPQ